MNMTDNHARIPPLSFLQVRCPSCHPINSVKALKAYLLTDLLTYRKHTVIQYAGSYVPLITSLRHQSHMQCLYSLGFDERFCRVFKHSFIFPRFKFFFVNISHLCVKWLQVCWQWTMCCVGVAVHICNVQLPRAQGWSNRDASARRLHRWLLGATWRCWVHYVCVWRHAHISYKIKQMLQ